MTSLTLATFASSVASAPYLEQHGTAGRSVDQSRSVDLYKAALKNLTDTIDTRASNVTTGNYKASADGDFDFASSTVNPEASVQYQRVAPINGASMDSYAGYEAPFVSTKLDPDSNTASYWASPDNYQEASTANTMSTITEFNTARGNK
jgi:hypothetical protein